MAGLEPTPIEPKSTMLPITPHSFVLKYTIDLKKNIYIFTTCMMGFEPIRLASIA